MSAPTRQPSPASAPAAYDVLPQQRLAAPRSDVAGRAALSVAMLLGYVLACVGVLVGLAHLTVQALLVRGGGFLGSKLAVVTVLAGLAMARAVTVVERRGDARQDGLAATRAGQPALWALVDDVARELRVPPPDELWLVDDVAASVRQDTRLLGLVGGHRHLSLGVALVQAVTVDELRAVVGHELGHYAGGDTRLSPLVHRAGQTLERTAENLGPRTVLGWLFGRYERAYQRVSLAVRRRQELRADVGAVRVAGRATHARALTRIRAAARAWGSYIDGYVVPVWQTGAAPVDLYDGFRHYLHDPTRRQQLEELGDVMDSGPGDPYDSHPSPVERLTALQGLPDRPPRGDDRPARELLSEVVAVERLVSDLVSARVLGSVPQERCQLSELLDAAPYVALVDEHVAELARAVAKADGGPLPTTLSRALALLEAEQDQALGTALTGDRRQLGERERAWQVRALVTGPLSTAAACALVSTGRARWQARWSGPVHLVDLAGNPLDLPELLDDVLTRDGVRGLRPLLLGLEVPLDDALGPCAPAAARDVGSPGPADGPADRPLDDVLAVWPGLSRGRARFDGYVTAELLVLVRQPRTWRDDVVRAIAEVYKVGGARVREAAHDRVRDVLSTPLGDLRSRPGVVVLRWDDLPSASLRGHWDKAWALRLAGQPRPVDRLLAEDDGLAGDLRSNAALLRRLLGERLDCRH